MAENILTRTKAQFPWIIFGDGLSAEIWNVTSVIDEDGIDCYEFLMRPSALTIHKYNLKPGTNMSDDGFVLIKYPKSLIQKLSDDPVNGRWLAFCSYNGKPTPLSNREFYYTSQINALQRINDSLQTENAVLYSNLKTLSSKHNIYYKDIIELFKEIQKVRPILSKNKPESGEEEEYD